MAHNIKHLCTTCNLEIRANNFKKHISICKGIKVKKIRGIDFDPNAGYKDGSRFAWNKDLTKDSDIRVRKNSESISKSLVGKELNGCCSKTYLGSSKHIESARKGGGYREGSGRSKKFKVYDSFGKQTTLQSTYEYAVFEILCELEIRWIRPKALKYDDRNYFGDFYLIDFDVYLDPKNDYKAKLDASKIFKVIEQNGVNLFVLHQHQITKQYIASLTQW